MRRRVHPIRDIESSSLHLYDGGSFSLFTDSSSDRSAKLWRHQRAQPEILCDGDGRATSSLLVFVGRISGRSVWEHVEDHLERRAERERLPRIDWNIYSATALLSALIPTSIRSDLLIHKLQRKLHLARSVRGKDIVECRRTDVAIRQPEVRAVHDVKQLRAELDLR